MNDEAGFWRRPRPWIVLVAVVVGLLFLYFYQPFQGYLLERIPGIRFSNVLFWFASLVGVAAYVIAHWQSFRRQVFRDGGELDATGLVYDTLQIAILVAVIFFAGAVIQAIEMLSEQLMAADGGAGADAAGPHVGFGARVASIVVMVLLAVLFYLLHYLVRALRTGWRPRRPPPRTGGGPPDSSRPPASPSAPPDADRA